MSPRTCFVIMPIGNQSYNGTEITALELKRRYDDLIREALLVVNPRLEITRADEIALPGSITSDILTRIMRSDLVVADVSYPNPNVFYELGLRHACKSGTIIIRDAKTPKPPFDIAHLRHIEYENTPTGLKNLAESFRQYFAYFASTPDRPDNQFLELAKLTEYPFPDYTIKREALPPELEAILAIASSPELLGLAIGASQGQTIDPMQLIQAIAAQPDVARKVLGSLANAGKIPGILPTIPLSSEPPSVVASAAQEIKNAKPRKKGPNFTKKK